MIRQSFSYWCVANRGLEPEALLAGAAKIGYAAVELIDEKLWPFARQAGLQIAATGGHGTIDDGLNREENFPRIEQELRENIAKAGVPGVTAASGPNSGGNFMPCLWKNSGVAPVGATPSALIPMTLPVLGL